MYGVERWPELLRGRAAELARVAMTNVRREYPFDLEHLVTGPGDVPMRPRDRNPVFYGSFDYHSCIQMHWVLVHLLRVAGESVPQDEIRTLLDEQLTADGLQAEAAFQALPANRYRLRPYRWGWGLLLAHDLEASDDPDLQRWAANLRPFANVLVASFLEWLGPAARPVRHGEHVNSAFGLSRALPYARSRAKTGDDELLRSLSDTALRWFGRDSDYPGWIEPSGADFLSPALVEAELVGRLLAAGDFASWLESFLPRLAEGEPANLFEPVAVPPSADGYTAHLHGLNLSRAWAWRRIAQRLPAGDPRADALLAAAARHADAVLEHVPGESYATGHWLTTYAVLMLSPEA